MDHIGIDVHKRDSQIYYAMAVERVQIEGHADSRPAEDCASLRKAGLRRDNWMLSSFRALEVRDYLESVVVGRDGGDQQDIVRKVEAVGRGSLHPRDPQRPASVVNRRIEITVHSVEKRGS